jgi:oligopeptide transport system ATP-binding protein
VMYLGCFMEEAPAKRLTARPAHPYTQALIASVPIPDPALERARPRPVLEGDLPSPLSPPSGCVFRTRCPKARPACAGEAPPIIEIERGHRVACPYWDEPNPAMVEAAREVQGAA